MIHKPKIMLMGYGRHGKDTVADILRDKYGYTHVSSSWKAAEVLFPLLQTCFGYDTVDLAYKSRHDEVKVPFVGAIKMREVWHEAIKLLNYGDKTTLSRAIFKDNDIYVGIRSREEFKAAREAGLFDFAIWVDASERCPPEEAGSCTVSKDMAGIVLDNNGTLEELEEKVEKLVYAMESIYYEDNLGERHWNR